MGSPDPTLVGNNFIIRYYTILSHNSESLHHFYSDRSTRTFGNEDEDATPLKGTEEIKKHIKSRTDFERSQVALSSVDCQGSANGGIFISVVGHFSGQGPTRKFTQTFFLEHFDDKYYVLNDIFRFLNSEGNSRANEEEEEENEEPEVVEESAKIEAPVASPVTPASVVAQPAATPAPAVTAAPAPSTASVTVPPAAHSKPEPPLQSKVESSHSTKPEPVPQSNNKSESRKQQRSEKKVAEHTEAAKGEPKSGTWASIVKSDHEKSAAAPAQPQSQQQHHAQAQKNTQAPQVTKEKESKSSKSWPVLNKECSLYASGLAFNTTSEQLMNAFSPYGKVTEIVLKANKGFAFIAFDSPQTVQSALDAIPSKSVTLPGQANPIVIEQRKPNKHNAPVTLPHHHNASSTAGSTASTAAAATPTPQGSSSTSTSGHGGARGGGSGGRGSGRGGPRSSASPRVPRDDKGFSSPHFQQSSQSQPQQSGAPSPHYAPKRTNNNTNNNTNNSNNNTNNNYDRRSSSEFVAAAGTTQSTASTSHPHPTSSASTSSASASASASASSSSSSNQSRRAPSSNQQPRSGKPTIA